ncbi:MAG TPA: hypothetical protein VI322_04295 [Candidatus Saccharimonadia bacterium]
MLFAIPRYSYGTVVAAACAILGTVLTVAGLAGCRDAPAPIVGPVAATSAGPAGVAPPVTAVARPPAVSAALDGVPHQINGAQLCQAGWKTFIPAKPGRVVLEKYLSAAVSNRQALAKHEGWTPSSADQLRQELIDAGGIGWVVNRPVNRALVAWRHSGTTTTVYTADAAGPVAFVIVSDTRQQTHLLVPRKVESAASIAAIADELLRRHPLGRVDNGDMISYGWPDGHIYMVISLKGRQATTPRRGVVTP